MLDFFFKLKYDPYMYRGKNTALFWVGFFLTKYSQKVSVNKINSGKKREIL